MSQTIDCVIYLLFAYMYLNLKSYLISNVTNDRLCDLSIVGLYISEMLKLCSKS